MGEEESGRHREEEVRETGRKRNEAHRAQQCKALEVLCISVAPERLVGRQQREKRTQNPHLKKHSLCCLCLCFLHTLIRSEPPLCMVFKLDYEVANAFSAADKRSGFSSRENVCEISTLRCSKMSTPEVGNINRPWNKNFTRRTKGQLALKGDLVLDGDRVFSRIRSGSLSTHSSLFL